MKLTKFDVIRWQETPRMRWRLVGVKRFATDFISGVVAWALLFGVIAGLFGLVAGSSMSRSEHWAAVGLGAGMGAAIMLIMGWWPTSVRLHSNGLWCKGIIRVAITIFPRCRK